jgi:hypothetical protein
VLCIGLQSLVYWGLKLGGGGWKVTLELNPEEWLEVIPGRRKHVRLVWDILKCRLPSGDLNDDI